MAKVNPEVSQAAHNPPDLKLRQGQGWTINEGRASTSGGGQEFHSDGVIDLNYNNPFGYTIERAWYEGKIVYAIVGEKMHVEDTEKIKVAKEYQPVYEVELDDKGWVVSRKEVPGQFNIYDSVPGQPGYSAIWKFYFVIVPKDFEPNSLRSVQDCLDSGYDIRESNFYRN